LKWVYDEEDIKNLLFPAFDVVSLVLDDENKTITAEIKTRNAVKEIRENLQKAATEAEKKQKKKEKDAAALYT